MKDNLYIDSLTGISNLFALFQSDLENMCGDKGTVLFIDIKSLVNVNKDFGRKVGDLYIKTVAEILTLDPLELHPIAFRFGGDKFIVFFPAHDEATINHLADILINNVTKKMKYHGVKADGVYCTVYTYSEKIDSLSKLLKQIYECRYTKYFYTAGENIALPDWADHLIGCIFNRVSDTLQLLEDKNTLAYTDEISQLPNHRSATHFLINAIKHYNLTNKPFSILFIDGDNLRRYNELGYNHGNKMIKNLASIISSVTRDVDKVFRWLSGDEFIVILKDTDKEDAFPIAERLRLHIQHQASNWSFPVTVSIGVSGCPVDGNNLDSIMIAAEKANLRAKRAGKNCVVI